MSFVIIGNGAAAVSAVEALREKGYSGDITMITPETTPAYTPCFLADFVKDSASEERLFIKDKGFYEKHRVNLVSGVYATGIDTEDRKVKLSDSGEIKYRKLLIACGAKSVVPLIKGLDGEGVFTFKSLNDAKRLIQAIENKKRFLIIGAGFIGLEVAEALKHKGCEAVLVEKETQVLPGVLDNEGAEIVENKLKDNEVEVFTDTMVTEVRRDKRGKIHGAITNKNQFIECDAVVLSVGVKPDIGLVKDTPIRTSKGILVGPDMMSSVRDVFAAGDIAEIEIGDKKRWLPIHPLAVSGGRVAGENMAGFNSRIDWIPHNLNVLRLFGIYICSIGETSGEHCNAIRQRGGMKKFFMDNKGRLKGVELIGSVERAGLFLSAIQKSLSVNKEFLYRPHYLFPDTL